MDEIRSALTVISLVTFIGIVWWAWRPGSASKASAAVDDMLADDDRDPHVIAVPANRGAGK